MVDEPENEPELIKEPFIRTDEFEFLESVPLLLVVPFMVKSVSVPLYNVRVTPLLIVRVAPEFTVLWSMVTPTDTVTVCEF